VRREKAALSSVQVLLGNRQLAISPSDGERPCRFIIGPDSAKADD
jgi:hypothetical protein